MMESNTKLETSFQYVDLVHAIATLDEHMSKETSRPRSKGFESLLTLFLEGTAMPTTECQLISTAPHLFAY